MTWSKMARGPMGRRHTDAPPSFTPSRQGGIRPSAVAHSPAPPTGQDRAVAPPQPPQTAPAPPAELVDLIVLCLGEDASMQGLARAASQDPALADLFLHAARITGQRDQSLSQSILTLGLGEARSLGFVHAVLAILPQSLPAKAQASLFESGLRRAAIAERIAEEAGLADVWPAFAAGFAAEMGAAYLAESYPHLAQAIVSLWQQPGEERASAETLMFGAEHGQAIADSPLGVMLTVPIRDALRGHHGHRPGPLGAIVAAADRVAELVQAPDPLSRLTAAEQAVAIAGGRTPSQGLLQHAGRRVSSLAGALKRSVGRQPSPEQLLKPLSDLSATSHKRGVLAFRRGRSNPAAGGLDSLDSKAQLGAQLQACCDRSEKFSILFLNFDQFGRINDTFGVPAGDLVIEALASGVRGCLSSPADRIARVGGDTFAIFMPKTGSKLGQITAERIRSMIERHHVHLGGHFRIASSVTLCGSSFSPAGASEAGSAAVIRAMTEGLRAAQRRSRNRTTWTSL